MGHTPSVESMERFLRVRLAGGDHEAEGPQPAAARPFVTISRQSGAGGQMLAQTMIDVFDRQPEKELFGHWQVFDQALCELAAEDSRLKGSLDSLLTEDYRSRTEEFFHQFFSPTADQAYVMEAVFRAVRMLAGVGHVIIVGRGGSEVTRDMPLGVALRLVAPVEVRIRRLMEGDRLDERRAKEKVRQSDAARARLLKRHFAADIDDPLLYDATFNTDRISHEAISEAVAGAIRSQVITATP